MPKLPEALPGEPNIGKERIKIDDANIDHIILDNEIVFP